MTAALATLNPAARVTLADCELRIERGLQSFRDMGSALAEIRDSRLYKGSHGTFEAYCHERWSLTPQHANRLIAAAEVADAMEPIGSTPTTESQARELTKLPEADRAKVWSAALELSGGKPTAKAIRDAAETIKPRPAPTRKPLGPKPAPEPEAPDEELLAVVVSALADAGPFGRSVAEIWTKTTVHSSRVAAALDVLAELGRVAPVETANGGTRWALGPETPEPTADPTPVGGSGPTPAPVVDAPAPAREPDPDVAEALGAEQREARADLLRVVDLLSPTGGTPDHVETWARRLGPYDDELAELVDRAHNALAALDDLINAAGGVA